MDSSPIEQNRCVRPYRDSRYVYGRNSLDVCLSRLSREIGLPCVDNSLDKPPLYSRNNLPGPLYHSERLVDLYGSPEDTCNLRFSHMENFDYHSVVDNDCDVGSMNCSSFDAVGISGRVKSYN